MKKLNIEFVREQFPSLKNDWIFFDNAGGSQIVKHSVDRINEYLLNTNVQLGASYEISAEATERVQIANKKMAEFINAQDESEIIMGGSSTMLLRQLAESLRRTLSPGDEIIVTDCDHEANIGAWRNLAEFGLVIREWRLNTEDYHLHVEDLQSLMTEKTKLVALTNASNILGTINPIREIADIVHKNGSLICVDGVAYAPHRLIDVQESNVDFYVFSLYKVYGPHYSVLYGKQEILESLPGINHFFIPENKIPYKFQPGSQNYELSWGAVGIIDYLEILADKHNIPAGSFRERAVVVFEMIKQHETDLQQTLFDFLDSKPNVKIIGEDSHDPAIRVPTVSFVVENKNSEELTKQIDRHKIGIRFGDFYARRLIDHLGLEEQNGVVRISMVHYNTVSEVVNLISALDEAL